MKFRLVINIIATIGFMYWPVILMFSPMYFDAPGSMDNKKHIVTMMLILYYPVLIGAFLYLFNISYFFNIQAKSIVVFFLIVITGLLYIMGYFKMLDNAYKGIKSSGYSVYSGSVYYRGEVVEEIDAKTFKTLNDYYSVDKNNVYLERHKIVGADPLSFKQVAEGKRWDEGSYWKDRNNVYCAGVLLEGADVASFESLGHNVGRDGKRYYLGAKVLNVDYETYKWHSSGYFGHVGVDKNSVNVNGDKLELDMDIATLDFDQHSTYWKDAKSVYIFMGLNTKKVEGADVGSFRPARKGDYRNYYVDSNRVYYYTYHNPEDPRNGVIQGADVESFEVTGYKNETKSDARDKNSFYLNGEKVISN